MVSQAAELQLPMVASALTLLSLVAVVPVAAVALLVLTALPGFDAIRGNLQAFVGEHLFLPSFSATVTRYVNAFAAAAGQLSSVGLVLFVAIAMRALLTIDSTMNRIWRAPRPRPLLQRLALGWALLTLGPVLLGGVAAARVALAERLAAHGFLASALSWPVPLALTVVVLALLYRLSPNVPVPARDAIAGALLAAGLLELLKRALAWYVVATPGVSVVYGAFAAFPLFLLWLFAVWMSVLVGAVFAANLGDRGAGPRAGPRPPPGRCFERDAALVGELLRGAPAALPALRLRAHFDDDAAEAEAAAGRLAELGYLVRTWPRPAEGAPGGTVWDEWWLPVPDLAQRPLLPLFERHWGAGTAVASPALAGPAHAWFAAVPTAAGAPQAPAAGR